MSNNFSEIPIKYIVIKLNHNKELILRVSLDDWVSLIQKGVFEVNSYYIGYIEGTFNNSVDNDSVIKDGIDHKTLLQTIKKNEWNPNEFSFSAIGEYDYLVNGILGITCGNSFGKNNGYGVIINIPTNNYGYFKDKIFFQLTGNKMRGLCDIEKFMTYIKDEYESESEPNDDSKDCCVAKYTFEYSYTCCVITIYKTYTSIKCYVGNE